eukprot:scaffold651313_cov28-Prasinocladus_malaysianus.AAC.1
MEVKFLTNLISSRSEEQFKSLTVASTINKCWSECSGTPARLAMPPVTSAVRSVATLVSCA